MGGDQRADEKLNGGIPERPHRNLLVIHIAETLMAILHFDFCHAVKQDGLSQGRDISRFHARDGAIGDKYAVEIKDNPPVVGAVGKADLDGRAARHDMVPLLGIHATDRWIGIGEVAHPSTHLAAGTDQRDVLQCGGIHRSELFAEAFDGYRIGRAGARKQKQDKTQGQQVFHKR